MTINSRGKADGGMMLPQFESFPLKTCPMKKILEAVVTEIDGGYRQSLLINDWAPVVGSFPDWPQSSRDLFPAGPPNWPDDLIQPRLLQPRALLRRIVLERRNKRRKDPVVAFHNMLGSDALGILVAPYLMWFTNWVPLERKRRGTRIRFHDVEDSVARYIERLLDDPWQYLPAFLDDPFALTCRQGDNAARQILRLYRVGREHPTDCPADVPSSPENVDQLLREIFFQMQTVLRGIEFNVFYKNRCERFELSEIAQMMGVSRSTAYRAYYAADKLFRQLAREIGGEEYGRS